MINAISVPTNPTAGSVVTVSLRSLLTNWVVLYLCRYADAVVDCTTAISLDPLYIKAYLRRASAKAAQHALDEALGDYERVLTLEPNNKQAKNEKSKIQKVMYRMIN